MRKKRIAMVDFWSVCDENGKPIGHGEKVGNEYYEYIKSSYDVTQYVNRDMLPYLHNPQKIGFRDSLQYGVGKVKRIISNFRCLREVYGKEKDSVIWFYVPDIYLFLFILLTTKGKRRIAVNIYEEYAGHRIKNGILRYALRKADKIFVTNRVLLSTIPKGVLIPDYAYREEVYGKYAVAEKKEQAVCLGTMNEKKQLIDAVKAFSKNGYPLYIAGQFSSKESYEQLCRIKGKNITIEDRYIDTDEYYQLLASSKYCLIPYDAEFYKNRTSGVIQECLFTNTVPLSEESILKFSHIQGIGYKEIEELETLNLEDVDVCTICQTYKAERECFYRYDNIKNTIIDALNSLSEDEK
ncbi:MAG: hypothetical protein NC541_06110 [bacterium]|nr:hypothetical protein [bacterium]